MKRGTKTNVGYRRGETGKGHSEYTSNDDKMEPVNRESENCFLETDDLQDPWDPDIEYDEWNSDAEDDDTLK